MPWIAEFKRFREGLRFLHLTWEQAVEKAIADFRRAADIIQRERPKSEGELTLSLPFKTCDAPRMPEANIRERIKAI